jgi:hypothetical protein
MRKAGNPVLWDDRRWLLWNTEMWQLRRRLAVHQQRDLRELVAGLLAENV